MQFSSILALIVILGAPALNASTRFYGPQYLVAGSSESGTQDGHFDQARFREPAGLAVSSAGGKSALFVLDREASTLRQVQLEDGDKVSTVAGNGQPGRALEAAASCLDHPESLQASPKGTLLIEDRGNSRWLAFEPGSSKLNVIKKLEPDASAYTRPWLDPKSGRIYYGHTGKGGVESMAMDGGQLKRLKTTGITFSAGTWVLPMGQGSDILVVDGDSGQLGRLAVPGAGSPSAGVSPTAAALAEPSLLNYEALKQNWSPGVRPVLAPYDTTGYKFRVMGWDPSNLWFATVMDDFSVSYLNPMEMEAGTLTRFTGGRARGALQASAWGAWDGATSTLYFSDTKALRVLALRPFFLTGYNIGSVNSYGLSDVEYPAKVPPNTRRLLLVSDSQGINMEPGFGYTLKAIHKQLELELNFLASHEGSGERFEVLAGGKSLSLIQGGLVGHLLNLEKVIQEHGISEVLMLYTPHLLLWEALEYTRLPLDANGLPVHEVDPEFLLNYEAAASGSKPLEEFKAWFADVTKTSESIRTRTRTINAAENSGALMNDPQFVKLAVPVIADQWIALAAWAKAHHLHITIVKALDRNAFGKAEMQSPNFFSSEGMLEDHLAEGMHQAALKAGFGWIDLGPETRLLEPVIYPLYLDNDWHWNPRGHHWLARLTADALWKGWHQGSKGDASKAGR